jgi:sugar/nucleoside kinase (ribokinase family)
MAASPTKHRTISIGGATYDLFVRTDTSLVQTVDGQRALAFPLGSKLQVKEVIEASGGGACNTSVGLARLGSIASFCGAIGSDEWGQRLLANLKREKVNTESATIIDGEMSSFSVIFSVEGGDRAILYSTGTNEHLQRATFDKEKTAACDWVYLNHLHEKSCVIEEDLLAIFEATKHPQLTWNPGGAQLKQGIEHDHNRRFLAVTDLLMLNKEEALLFTHTESVDDALAALLKAGAQVVCITDGGNGATAATAREAFHCPAIAGTTIIDTTGAGDAFGVGATWALLHGFDLPTMLRAGTINATSVLESIGAEAGLLTDTEMRRRLDTTSLSVTPLSSPLQNV